MFTYYCIRFSVLVHNLAGENLGPFLRNLVTKIKQNLRIVLILGRVRLVRIGFAVAVVCTVDERTSGSDCHGRRCTLLRSLERVKTSFHVHHPRQSNREEVEVVFGGQMTPKIRHDGSGVQRSGFNVGESLVKLLGKQEISQFALLVAHPAIVVLGVFK
jgi:hypothetical protein